MGEPRRHDVVVIGAGVSGIYQIKRLVDLGVDAIVLEADDDLGGTWYRNRYPGCRFDSESYTYGYSFSKELLDEWHWKERFSSQPENLRYLNYVADKFDLRRHMRFDARVERMTWDEDECVWHLTLADGDTYAARFVITASARSPRRRCRSYEGMDDFAGESFHTFHWPTEPVELAGQRVGSDRHRRHRHPGHRRDRGPGRRTDRVPAAAELERTRSTTARSPKTRWQRSAIATTRSSPTAQPRPAGSSTCPTGGASGTHTAEERRAIWDELYDSPGFAILVANFGEIFFDEEANAELSDYIADRIRARVDDPAVAEKLIPRDHGFGLQRLPLETNYFEAYNRDNVELVDLSDTPIERITSTGIQTTGAHHELDVIVYATGFDAITGAYDRIDIRGVDGTTLAETWRDGPGTYVGVLTRGFPNLFMVAGPQSVSGSTNFPRAIETGVDWVTDLIEHAAERGHRRVEAESDAEQEWVDEVVRAHERLLFRRSKGWFTGYNSNVAGHQEGQVRYQAYFGGAPRYRDRVDEIAADGYRGIDLS